MENFASHNSRLFKVKIEYRERERKFSFEITSNELDLFDRLVRIFPITIYTLNDIGIASGRPKIVFQRRNL